MKFKNYISVILLVFMLLCSYSSTVSAYEIPDEDMNGTITVEMTSGGKAVTGGILTAFRVGEIRNDNGNYSFVKTSIMDAFTGAYDDIESPTLAEDIFSFVTEHNIPDYATAENHEGKVIFSDLELGLYLIVQTKNSDGFEPLKAFLVSVPMNEDGHYVYDVNAKGKFSLTQDSTTPDKPTKPTDPSLPQTGQLKWPIPVFTAVGLCLFSVGWALRFGKKRNRNEK